MLGVREEEGVRGGEQSMLGTSMFDDRRTMLTVGGGGYTNFGSVGESLGGGQQLYFMV